MSKIVRVGPLVLDLDASVLEMVDGPAMRVHTQGMTFGPFPQKSAMYGDLMAYWDAQMDLYAYNQYQADAPLRSALDAAFDPFIDDNKVVNVYLLFHDLPDPENLVLCLESEDVGSVRMRGSYEPVIGWESVREAIDVLGRLKQARTDLIKEAIKDKLP